MSNLKDQTRPEPETHPSYGMVGLQRTMNGTRANRLHGSAVRDHAGTMRLVIKRGAVTHELHRDWHYGREELIEIEMSAAKYVELITNPNVGDGVPCTIRYARDESTGGKLARMPDVPDAPTEVERVKDDFGAELDTMVKVLRERRADIDTLTAELSAKSREAIRIALDVMIQQVTSNIPFVLDQFHKASDKVVTAAKHEIEAFTSSVLRAAGMEAIADGRIPKALGVTGTTDPRGRMLASSSVTTTGVNPPAPVVLPGTCELGEHWFAVGENTGCLRCGMSRGGTDP